MFEIIKGLYKLASLGVPYLALCPANVLISSKGEIKLSHALDYYIIGPDNSNQYYISPQESHVNYLFKLDT